MTPVARRGKSITWPLLTLLWLLFICLLAACARPTATATPTLTFTPTATATATPTPTATPIPQYTVNLRPVELKGARDVWNKRALSGYQMRLVAGPPFYFYILTVVETEVTSAHRSREPLAVALDDLPDALTGARMAPLYNLRHLWPFTVEGLFERVTSYYERRPQTPPCDTQVAIQLNGDWAFPRRIVERWADYCQADGEPAWVDVFAFVTLTPTPTAVPPTATATATPVPTATATPTPTNTPVPSATATASPTSTLTRNPAVSIERRPVGDGWDELRQTSAGYALLLPDTWRDFDPAVERELAEQQAYKVSPCLDALLDSLLSGNAGAEFSLLAFDESLSVPDQTDIPASLAIGHAETPLSLPITLLISEFTRQMNAIPGVTVIESGNRPKINGLSAAQLTLRIEGLCDAAGRAVPTIGYQIYLADGTDIHIMTFIAPDAVYQDYHARFVTIGESFRRTD